MLAGFEAEHCRTECDTALGNHRHYEGIVFYEIRPVVGRWLEKSLCGTSCGRTDFGESETRTDSKFADREQTLNALCSREFRSR